MREDDQYATREAVDAPETDVDGFSAYHYKPARDKKGKRRDTTSPPEAEEELASAREAATTRIGDAEPVPVNFVTPMEPGSTLSTFDSVRGEKPVETVPAGSHAAANQVEYPQPPTVEAEPEDEWNIPVKKTRKKGKKGSKASSKATSGATTPMDRTEPDMSVTPLLRETPTTRSIEEIEGDDPGSGFRAGLLAAGAMAGGLAAATVISAPRTAEKAETDEPLERKFPDADHRLPKPMGTERSASLPTTTPPKHEPPKSRVASLFPGLDRVKRKEPPRQNSLDVPAKRMNSWRW